MKRTFTIIAAIVLFSCNNSSIKNEPELPSQIRYLITYPMNDSQRTQLPAWKWIRDSIIVDSATHKRSFTTKVEWYFEVPKVLIDSVTRKPKLDSLGNMVTVLAGYQKLADSLVIQVSPIPYDSLIKRKK